MVNEREVRGHDGRSAAEIFAINEQLNQMVMEHLDPAAWHAKPTGNIRTIAAIFSHMHNVRCKWVRLTAPHLKVPAQLNRTHCTQAEARAALAASAARCVAMLADAEVGRVTKFVRDGWARPWSVGPAMLSYMMVHEAHHRGQVCMLAHELGYALPSSVDSGLWDWEKLG